MPSESPLFTSDQEHLRLLNALRESELLRELSELLASSLDPTHILQILVRRTTEVCEVERCAVWLLDESRSLFLPSAYHLSTQHMNKKILQAADYVWHRSSLPFNDPLIYQLLREEHSLLFLQDLREASSQSMHNIAEKFFVRSILLIALIRDDRPVGIISLDNPGSTITFSQEQQQLARAIGQQAAIAIHNARLYQQAQIERERAERLITRAQSIYTVAMAVNSNKDLPTVLEIATQHFVRGLSARDATIALLEADTLTLAATTRKRTLHISPSTELPSSTLTNLPHCITTAEMGVPSFVTRQQVEGQEKHWYEQLGLERVLLVPLMTGDLPRIGDPGTDTTSHEQSSAITRCVGFAFINYPKAVRHPSQGQYAFAQDIAAQCALAIEKAQILAAADRAATLATERANTLDAVFNAMTEGIMVLNQDGQCIISNTTAKHFLGLPPESQNAPLQLTSFLEHHPIHSLRGQKISPTEFPLSRALQGEQVRGDRFVTRRADDSERAVEVNVEPLFDSEARQIGIVGAFRDVTEQVRVERRIRRALDTMLHAAEAISGITDIKEILHRVLAMTLTALNCDRGVVQLYDQEDAIFTPLLSIGFTGETATQWVNEQTSWLAPEAYEYTGFRDQLLDGHATLINAEQYPEHPNPFQNTMILASPITHNGRILGIMLLDRSLRKERENRQGATRLLVNAAFNIWDMAVAEGITQFAGLAIEQARWQQEAEIARTNEETMRKSNALKDEFLAITAHEFRTPLTVILAHSQMMARNLRRTEGVEPKLREKFNESIAIIDVQTHQLTNIVNTFLEVTRLNRGQIELNREEINLEDIVQQTVADYAATSPIHQISYAIEPCERPYLVLGDKARLLQIFANLLHNAIKYSSLGGPITVSLAQYTMNEEKHIIEVHIKDSGIGIPPDAQPHLFKRFYRAPNTEASNVRGIGLGLYVVAEFLRLHGGTIHVESSGVIGEGSCFIFTLPLLERNYQEE